MVLTHDLYFPKLAIEKIPILTKHVQDKGKEALKTSIDPELKDWRLPYFNFNLFEILPNDPKKAAAIKRKASHIYYNAMSRTLYRCTPDGLLLCCLSTKEAQEGLKEAHDGTCGPHQSGQKIHDRIKKMAYYCKMFSDFIKYAKQFHAFQIHGDFIHRASGHLHTTKTTWPFEMWEMDAIDPISPTSSKGHWFIHTLTNYFSKWSEAISLREVKAPNVVKFIKYYVIYHFEVP